MKYYIKYTKLSNIIKYYFIKYFIFNNSSSNILHILFNFSLLWRKITIF